MHGFHATRYMKKVLLILLLFIFIPQNVFADTNYLTQITNTSDIEKGTVTIKKQIPRKTFDALEAAGKLSDKAAFTFQLSGQDIFSHEVNQEKSISFQSVDKTDTNVYGSDFVTLSVSFPNLEHGTYTISEVNPKECTITKVFPQNNTESFLLDKTTVSEGITLSNNENSATFTINKDTYNHSFLIQYKNIPSEGSIKIKKNNAAGQPLKGVKFKITKEGSDNSTMGETDANGILNFPNLSFGNYVLTEIKTTDGNTLLKDPVTITIPYVATEEEVSSEHLDTSKAIFSERENKWLFPEFGYTINNTANLNLPATGSIPSFPVLGLFGMALFIIGTYQLSNKKRSKI